MRKLITILILFCTLGASAQTWNIVNGNYRYPRSFGIPVKTLTAPFIGPADTAQIWLSPVDSLIRYTYKGTVQTLRTGAGGDSLISSGTISSLPQIGDVVPANITAGNWIMTEFYKSQPPTAGLSGGTTTELHSAGTFTPSLSWSAGRQSATAPISTITVAGTSETFSQPAQGATVSGTQTVTVTYNTNQSFTNNVVTTDGKTASASTAFYFLPNRYWGVSTGTPVGSDLLSATGGGQELTTSISKGAFTITVSGSTKNIFYAYPSNEGTLSSIIISGIESIGAFTTGTFSFTNASGYTQTYRYYKSNNTFSATTVSINSIN